MFGLSEYRENQIIVGIIGIVIMVLVWDANNTFKLIEDEQEKIIVRIQLLGFFIASFVVFFAIMVGRMEKAEDREIEEKERLLKLNRDVLRHPSHGKTKK